MPFLKTEPLGVLETLDELFALAHAMESEAAAKYAEFGAAMRAQGHDDLAAVFEGIAAEERGHVAHVDAWSEQRLGHEPNPAALRWLAPPTFEEEDAAEMSGSNLLTPYRVLTVATRNEERAFAFWSYVAANAARPEVRQAAETMAKEELGHVAAFRRERRKAFHAMRGETATPQARQAAADLELRLAKALDESPGGHFAELAAEARAMAVESRKFGLQAGGPKDGSAAALAEALVDAYLEGVDASEDEDQLHAVQQLAERAVRRLAALRSRHTA